MRRVEKGDIVKAEILDGIIVIKCIETPVDSVFTGIVLFSTVNSNLSQHQVGVVNKWMCINKIWQFVHEFNTPLGKVIYGC